MSLFFISYQRNSKAFAQDLKNRIDNSEFDILAWIDYTDIASGDEWKVAIDKGLEQCVAVIVVVTVTALRSQYVTYEWSYALGKGKRVIPIIHEKLGTDDKLHPKLDDRQYRDFIDPSEEQWHQFLNELARFGEQKSVPPTIGKAVEALSDHNPQVRANAVETLRDFDHPSAIEALAEAITSYSTDVSRNAALALAEKTNFQDGRALLGLELAISHPSTKIKSVASLQRMDNQQSVDILGMALEKSPRDPELRMQVINAFARMKHRGVVAELRKLLVDDGAKDLTIFETLEKWKDPQALPELIEFTSKQNHNSIIVPALKAIISTGEPEAVPFLFECLRKYAGAKVAQHAKIFETALEGIVNFGREEAISQLEQLRSDDLFARRERLLNNAIRQLKEKYQP